ncbi:MAG: hypothetical protein OHK0017_07990 [Patescibacteria group bacterium]
MLKYHASYRQRILELSKNYKKSELARFLAIPYSSLCSIIRELREQNKIKNNIPNLFDYVR